MGSLDVFLVVLAYCLGSVSFAVIVSRFMGMDDPRTYGSGNPGATNVLRSGRKSAAALTLAGDALKGLAAVLLAKWAGHYWPLNPNTVAFVAIAVMVGHMWPIFFRFRGGKGVATAAGVLFALSWPVGLICLAIWLVLAFGLKISSLAALAAALAAPIAAWFFIPELSHIMAIVLIVVLVIFRHHNNIRQLIEKREHKIGHES